ncbi:Rhodanese-like protein [Aspergillus sclerotioniger CBS 115572]|uniref:Rhodanese-like protein n=1 Tax=Aspergillus sclerotioniger CBS 115572 TaxID=1450535 RepID=A0A317V1L2_9EURO|nr:Rhodanese-like protein [Aspergillus sclerotioniger CBS 115572]PWY67955.1 Rhodanese-like protein [Aspergillus sclerotioniger CBS 115572]
MNPFTTPLITPTEYHNATSNPTANSRRIIPLAAYRPTLHASFESHHLPNSKFFPLHQIPPLTNPPTTSSLKHFTNTMTALDIHKSDILVIYDAEEIGTYHAPRLAFICEFFGHRNVHVLNNFKLWVGVGFPLGVGGVDMDITCFDIGSGVAGGYIVPEEEITSHRVISFNEVKDIVTQGNTNTGRKVQILDSRPAGRFRGVENETDASLRSGHIPGAVNVPLKSLLGGDEGVILSTEELRKVLVDAGALGDAEVEYILTCNSGVTAAALDLALRLVGVKGGRRLYDGSWMEWTRRVGDELIEVDT